VDLVRLSKGVRAHLPRYAQPLFVRLVSDAAVDMTGTYKLIKRNLQRQGYDPNQVGSDRIFFKGPKDKEYRPLHAHSMQDILKDLSVAKL
jgi:hypothetical protein